MGDLLIMSKKERDRKRLLEGYRHGKLTLKECAEKAGLSYRQMKRLWARYVVKSDEGLCHRNRGRTPCNAYSPAFRKAVLDLYDRKYMGFGPTFAAEKLKEDDGQQVNVETLRLWLKSAGMWAKKRRRVIYRERRERKPRFGELLQIDGSIHQWFSGERYDCLLNMVDDATGTTFALLDTGETTQILLTCLKRWIELYGIPKAVYVDLKSVYVGSKQLRAGVDDWVEHEGFSVFEQVCKKLNIQIIKAYSPQAKGRVERKHAVFQDRFVKSLKLYDINTIEAANEYLEKRFLPEINAKFTKAPKDAANAHRDPAAYGDLNELICWQWQRKLRNDWTIQFQRTYFQVRKTKATEALQPKASITIKKHLDGQIRLWHEEQLLEHGTLSRKPELPSRSKQYYVRKGPQSEAERSKIARNNKHKTPWSQFQSGWLSKNKRTEALKKQTPSGINSDLIGA